MQARSILTLVFTTFAALQCSLANADWPTVPDSPLVVGPINNGFDERAALVGAEDGSVWLCWQNNYCVGEVLLQRVTLDGGLLSPDAIAIQDDPTCGFHLPPLLIPAGQSVIATRALSGLQATPLQKFDGSAVPQWANGFTTEGPVGLGDAELMNNGDLLVVSQGFGYIQADRLDTDGLAVWDKSSEFDSGIGANFRILNIVSEPSGGAIVLWDSPLTYTRLISAMRINPDGTSAWAGPVRLTSVPPNTTSSRHSDPVVIEDGQGGAIVVFVLGFEQGSTPAPLVFQGIDADGALRFPIDGVRVSLSTERQFDPIVLRDSVSNDLIIIWRDGFLPGQHVRAQRMTIDGKRQWGDEGIEIGPLEPTVGSFDAVWNQQMLNVVLADSAGIELSRINLSGDLLGEVIEVADEGPSSFVKMAPSGQGLVVAWQVDTPTLDDQLVAQRINRFGALGSPPCSLADFTNDAQLDIFDTLAFITSFTNADPFADLDGDLKVDIFDVLVFIEAFQQGCP
jgi:hypothetical protein